MLHEEKLAAETFRLGQPLGAAPRVNAHDASWQ
jgi:hypothetical protein